MEENTRQIKESAKQAQEARDAAEALVQKTQDEKDTYAQQARDTADAQVQDEKDKAEALVQQAQYAANAQVQEAIDAAEARAQEAIGAAEARAQEAIGAAEARAQYAAEARAQDAKDAKDTCAQQAQDVATANNVADELRAENAELRIQLTRKKRDGSPGNATRSYRPSDPNDSRVERDEQIRKIHQLKRQNRATANLATANQVAADQADAQIRYEQRLNRQRAANQTASAQQEAVEPAAAHRAQQEQAQQEQAEQAQVAAYIKKTNESAEYRRTIKAINDDEDGDRVPEYPAAVDQRYIEEANEEKPAKVAKYKANHQTFLAHIHAAAQEAQAQHAQAQQVAAAAAVDQAYLTAKIRDFRYSDSIPAPIRESEHEQSLTPAKRKTRQTQTALRRSKRIALLNPRQSQRIANYRQIQDQQIQDQQIQDQQIQDQQRAAKKTKTHTRKRTKKVENPKTLAPRIFGPSRQQPRDRNAYTNDSEGMIIAELEADDEAGVEAEDEGMLMVTGQDDEAMDEGMISDENTDVPIGNENITYENQIMDQNDRDEDMGQTNYAIIDGTTDVESGDEDEDEESVTDYVPRKENPNKRMRGGKTRRAVGYKAKSKAKSRNAKVKSKSKAKSRNAKVKVNVKAEAKAKGKSRNARARARARAKSRRANATRKM